METGKDSVVVVGAGFVGATSAYAMMIQGVAKEIVLIDIDEKRLSGEVMDLNHGMPFVSPVRIRAGSYADCANASVAVICAGANQKPGETRLDLLRRNVTIMRSVVSEIVRNNPEIILLMVTNPVDILTYAALKLSGLPKHRVFGSGTALDSARLRYLLGEHCGVNAGHVHAYVVGEHGDTEVAAWSGATIGGMSVDEFCRGCAEFGDCSQKEKILSEIRSAAYQIIERKGATYYAVGLSVSAIVRAILRDENAVLPVSSLMTGFCGVTDICVSLPCVVNVNGIARVLEIELCEEEKQAFMRSAESLKEYARQLEL